MQIKSISIYSSILSSFLGLVLLLTHIATIGLPLEAIDEPVLIAWVRESQKLFSWAFYGAVLLGGGLSLGAMVASAGRPKLRHLLWIRQLIKSNENGLGAMLLLVVGVRIAVFSRASWKGHVYTESEFFIVPGVLIILCAFYLGGAAIDWGKIKNDSSKL